MASMIDGQDLYSEKTSVDLVNYYVSGFNTPLAHNKLPVELTGDICWSMKRLLLDLEELKRDAHLGIEGSAIEDNINFWNISFPAPNKKPIQATLHFPSNYPFSAPTMYITKRLFHPNITTEGKVCLEDLEKVWTPAHSLSSLILAVQYLIEDPNPSNNPVNPVAANTFLINPDIYQSIAWQCFEMLDSSGLVGDDLKEAALENASRQGLSSVTIVQQWSLQSALERSFSS